MNSIIIAQGVNVDLVTSSEPWFAQKDEPKYVNIWYTQPLLLLLIFVLIVYYFTNT